MRLPLGGRRLTPHLKLHPNKERADKGQPPRVLDQRYGIYSDARELGLDWKTRHPGWQPIYYEEARQIEGYFKKLIDVLYTDRGTQEPSINVVLFLAGNEEMRVEWEKSLKDYVRFFNGKYRIIRGLDEIKSASSAKSTNN